MPERSASANDPTIASAGERSRSWPSQPPAHLRRPPRRRTRNKPTKTSSNGITASDTVMSEPTRQRKSPCTAHQTYTCNREHAEGKTGKHQANKNLHFYRRNCFSIRPDRASMNAIPSQPRTPSACAGLTLTRQSGHAPLSCLEELPRPATLFRLRYCGEVINDMDTSDRCLSASNVARRRRQERLLNRNPLIVPRCRRSPDEERDNKYITTAARAVSSIMAGTLPYMCIRVAGSERLAE